MGSAEIDCKASSKKLLMKTKFNFISLKNLFKDGIVTNMMVTLANSIELPALGRRLGFRLLGACCPNLVKFTSRLRQLNSFIMYLLSMSKKHGAMYVVKYLKASQLAMQKRIAGTPVQSLSEIEPELPLPRLARCGLPKVIPRRDRQAILSGSPSIIRWWLTLFSLYRVIQVPGIFKLNTITDSYSGKTEALAEVSLGLEVLSSKLKRSQSELRLDTSANLLFLESGSPTSKISWMGLISDPAALRLHGLDRTIMGLMDALKLEALSKQFKTCLDWVDSGNGSMSEMAMKSYNGQDEDGKPLKSTYVGQLQTKLEAAGKIRVFAMVDIWTQSVLKPLHDHLFDILKSIPNDATFDQHAAVKRCFVKSKGAHSSWGYDLSAATDRLPVSLQEVVLRPIIGPQAARLWRELLVNRDYILPIPMGKVMEYKVLRYSVGQPMGALSSWAMLALTHHLIVQYARTKCPDYRVMDPWYEGYELLGDDIVIFDKAVASSYLSVMEDLGVAINLKKSVVATTDAFEFAKVTGFKGRNVSAISWKMFISQNHMMGRANIAYSLLSKDIVEKHIMRWMKTLCRQSKYKEGDYQYSLFAIFTMFANSGKISIEEVIKSAIDLAKPATGYYKSLLINCRVDYIQTIIKQLISGKEIKTDNTDIMKSIWCFDLPWAKLSVFGPVDNFAKGWDGEKMVVDMAREMADLVLPVPLGRHVCTYNQVFKLTGDWDERDVLQNEVYMIFFTALLRKIDRLGRRFIIWDKSLVDSPLSDILNWRSDMDRLFELRAICERADDKLTKVAPPVMKLGSPLKTLQWLKKLRRIQAMWLQEVKKAFMIR